MPLEWNTRTTVEVPELFVCGLLQASELPTLLGLGRIQPRYALEQHLVVLRREAPTPASAEWVDLGLRGREQEKAGRERGRQAAW